MGREQKREIARKLRKKGLPREVAEAYAERLTSETRNPRYAWEGEKVKLDVLQLTSYKEWKSEGIGPHRKKYQEWVLAHAGEVFTVEYDPEKVERGAKDVKTLVQLKEDTTEPKWLFWAGDLIPEPGQKAPKYEADIVRENEEQLQREKELEAEKINMINKTVEDKAELLIAEALLRQHNQILDNLGLTQFENDENLNNT